MSNKTNRFLVNFSHYEEPSLVEKAARTVVKIPSKLWRLIDEERERLIAQRGSNFSIEPEQLAKVLIKLGMWADKNEGMVGLNIIPPAPCWEGLSEAQRKSVIDAHKPYHEWWDGDTTSDWVDGELKKIGQKYTPLPEDEPRGFLNYSSKGRNFAFTSYRHITGKTGVKSYEASPKYPERIGVRFKRQRNKQPYYYSSEKIGKKHLEEMRRLADRGQGLNSYIYHNKDVYWGYDGPRRLSYTRNKDIKKLTVIEGLKKLLKFKK